MGPGTLILFQLSFNSGSYTIKTIYFKDKCADKSPAKFCNKQTKKTCKKKIIYEKCMKTCEKCDEDPEVPDKDCGKTQ